MKNIIDYKYGIQKKLMFGLLIIICSCTNCVDEVKIKLRQETKKLVVEGLLSNMKNFQNLRLSYTSSSGLLSAIEPVSGALIELYENESKLFNYRPIPNELGSYRPLDQDFVAKSGKSYYVVIKLSDGRIFKSSPQILPQPIDIKKITNVFSEKNNIGFNTSIDFIDPKSTNDYYRWTARGYHKRRSTGIIRGFGPTLCCTDCWVLKEDPSLNLFSDVVSNGGEIKNKRVFFSPFYALGKHFIEVNQYVITKEAYTFWQKYKAQQQRSGTIFDPLPAAIIGNVVNINNSADVALGFFEVAAISNKKTEADATTQFQADSFYKNDLYVPLGDCMKSYINSSYSESKPIGW